MKHYYQFNKASQAAQYGIGTYFRQLCALRFQDMVEMSRIIGFLLIIFLGVGCSDSTRTTKSQETQEKTSTAPDTMADQEKQNQYPSEHDTTRGDYRHTDRTASFYNIPYKKKAHSIKVQELFKNIKYVRLETNSNTFVKDDIDKIENKNGTIYIKDTKSSRQEVMLFDEKGRHVRNINRRGGGPEEYTNGVNIAVNGKGYISFADRTGKGRIVTYTSEGKFISRIELPGIDLQDLTYLNDTILALRSDMFKAGEKFHLLNMNTRKIVRSFYPKKYRAYHMWFVESFTAYQGKIIAAGHQSNDIVEVSQDTAIVKYTLNIGNKMPPPDFWESQPSYEVTKREEKSKEYIGHIPCFAENDRYMFVSFMGSLGQDNLQSLALIDKKTGQSRTYQQIILADNVIISPYVFFWQGNGKIVIPVWPDKVIDSANKEFLSQFPNLEQDDNPILLFGELK